MAKILLVEDDPLLQETLFELLESRGYRLEAASGANAALELLYEQHFDLMLFDVNIEDFSGFELLEMLRKSGNLTPCIFLTSLSDIASLSRGFLVGADDYLKKPFDFDELIIRIESLLRRHFQAKSNEINYKNLIFKIATNELFCDGVLLRFTPQESKLLSLFFSRINQTITKEELLFTLDGTSEASEGALRVYINKLRKNSLEIETIKGIGYRLVQA